MKFGVHSRIFGKNKSFEEVASKLRKLDIDFVEIKATYHSDIDLYSIKSNLVNLNPNAFKKINRLCSGLEFQFHPANRINGNIYSLTDGTRSSIELILDFAKNLSRYSNDFVIPIHLVTRYKKFHLSEEEAIENSKRAIDEIYKRWSYSGKIALETMFEYDKDEWSFLGYVPEHFEKIIEGKEGKVGVCMDLGHINKGLNDMVTFRDFLHLPIHEVHLHGNRAANGEVDDAHLPPTPETLDNYHEVVEFLKTYDGKISLEVKDHPSDNLNEELIKPLRQIIS